MKKVILIIIRILLVILSIFFFALFTIPMTSRIINPGNISGALLCIWVFCVSITPLHKRIKGYFFKGRFRKFLYRLVNTCFIAFSVYGIIITGAMVYCACQAPAPNSTAVVLGAQVKPWGPSIMLQGRINAADKYLKDNPNAKAVLTGGKGNDEPVSEAQSMYDTLIEQGIAAERLYKEDKATNTTENLEFSDVIIKNENLNQDIAIVTDGFHQLRARIIVAQKGIKGNVGAINSDTEFIYLPTYAVREWFALPYQVLFR